MAPARGGGVGATIVLDNGGDRLKIGISGDPKARLSIPNCTAKLKGQIHVLVGDEIDLVQNTANLQYSRPFDRGYLNTWDSEIQVWRRLFGEQKLKIEPEETQILVTEAPFTPDPLANYSTQVIFEEFGFASCAKMPAATLAAYHYATEVPKILSSRGGGGSQAKRREPDCVTVIDSGFSFTHIIPFYKGKAIREAVKRINVGGKLLTNYLKETVSYRQWNMMDEFQLMNDAKEALCYVALDFEAEMTKLRKPSYSRRDEVREKIRKNFVLPDFQTTMRGFVQDEANANAPGASEQQVLAMEVERFVVPEVLFRPSDIGLRQAGLSEAILQSIEKCDIGLRSSLYSNIVLTGGNMKFPGLQERLTQELRSMAAHHYPVNVYTPADPIEYAWMGGSMLGLDVDSCRSIVVTKAQYDELGAYACQSRVFGQW